MTAAVQRIRDLDAQCDEHLRRRYSQASKPAASDSVRSFGDVEIEVSADSDRMCYPGRILSRGNRR